MGSMKRVGAGRLALAMGAVAITGLMASCAPEPTGPPAPTTTTSTTLPWSDPVGTWTWFNLGCSVNVLGTNYPFSQAASVNIEAPHVVAQGETFNVMLAPGPFVIPTNVQGFDLTGLSAVTIRFPLSPNVEFVDSVMSAGINMGPGYPGVRKEGTDLVYNVPGPFAPGATVQMPKVRVTLKATGAAGSAVQFRLASLSSVASVGAITVPNVCTPPAPNPLLWSIAIASEA